VGYKAAMEDEKYDCIVLHDVDKWPEDTRNIYRSLTLIKKMHFHHNVWLCGMFVTNVKIVHLNARVHPLTTMRA